MHVHVHVHAHYTCIHPSSGRWMNTPDVWYWESVYHILQAEVFLPRTRFGEYPLTNLRHHETRVSILIRYDKKFLLWPCSSVTNITASNTVLQLQKNSNWYIICKGYFRLDWVNYTKVIATLDIKLPTITVTWLTSRRNLFCSVFLTLWKSPKRSRGMS